MYHLLEDIVRAHLIFSLYSVNVIKIGHHNPEVEGVNLNLRGIGLKFGFYRTFPPLYLFTD